MQLCIVASILLLQIDSSTNAQIATKIVGGQMDASDTATYQISLQGLVEKGANSNSNNSNGTTVRKYYHFCSGSIVSRQHVLTAAHCLAGWRAEQLRVVAGTKVWNSPEGIPHAVANIEIHNRYKKLNGHDIGMVSMKKLFVFSERISSIAIDNDFVPPGRDVVLTGWGYTLPIRDPGFLPHWIHAILKSYPKELQITHLKTISNVECRRSFRSMRLETELCTYKWGTGACAGDSGGPLVNAERDRLLGIVSFGFIYCGGYTGFPDGFTRVSNFTNWIADRITLLEERDDNMLT